MIRAFGTAMTDNLLSDENHCSVCNILVGRAGRSNKEIIAAIERGEFRTKVEAWNYQLNPPSVTIYCSTCFKDRQK